MDFSDIAAFNPSRIPLPGQAHVITAMVKGLQKDKGGFNSGEMGVGKSLMGAVAAYKYCNGRGRVVVLCPDHTIDKWADEIRGTVPNCRVVTFRNWKEVVQYYWSIMDSEALGPKRWLRPDGMEFAIVGRDQAKWMPECSNLGEEKDCFDGKRRAKQCSTRKIVGHRNATDEAGNCIWDAENGQVKREPITVELYRCPACGTKVMDRKKGVPINVATLKDGICCAGRYAEEVPSKDGTTQGLDRILLDRSAFADAPAGKLVRLDHIWQPDKYSVNVADPAKQYVIKVCGEPLWNYIPKPRRWAPADFIHTKMRGCFDVCIIDEAHEVKSLDADQAVAAGKLMASAGKVLLLTGTLIGGYAWHLFPILMRVRPEGLIREGIKWGQTTEFSRKYGRVARIVTTTQEDGQAGSVRSRRSASMRRIRSGGSQRERAQIETGVMPSLYAQHLSGCSVFLSMIDLADHMPPFHEYVGCDPAIEDDACDRNDPYWTNTACDMAPVQAMETSRITEICKAVNNDLLRKGSMRFLAATLVTTMEYPDYPWRWLSDFAEDDDQIPPLLGQSFLGRFNHQFDPKTESLLLSCGEDAERIPLKKENGVYLIDVKFNGKHTRPMIYDTGATNLSISQSMADAIGLSPKDDDHEVMSQIADGSLVPSRQTLIDKVEVGSFSATNVACNIKAGDAPHSVGYWKEPKLKTKDNWVGVVTPKHLSEDLVYPKERKLIEICKREQSAGNQVWVFCNQTGKRDVQPRLAGLLEKEGLTTGILRARAVKPRDRAAWIEKNCKNVDVMFSHPKPVMTGLDLLSKDKGGHNFNSIVFYQTGTHAFVVKQASRRGWRLIQDKRCRVYYLYYRNTMQHHFVSFMARKFAAMAAISGDFNMDGLIAMGGGDDGSLALCKGLDDVLDDSLIQANWQKAHGSFGEGDDAVLGVGGKNRCEITAEDLRRWDRIVKQIKAGDPAVLDDIEELASEPAEELVTAEELADVEEFTEEEREALAEPLVESIDLGLDLNLDDEEFSYDDDGWLSLSEDELALLDI